MFYFIYSHVSVISIIQILICVCILDFCCSFTVNGSPLNIEEKLHLVFIWGLGKLFADCLVLNKDSMWGQYIDSISLWRQQEHSFAVQKEHEAYIRDIAELKLQLKQEREKLDQAQERLSRTEVLNQSLHEDISLPKNKFPLWKKTLASRKSFNTAQGWWSTAGLSKWWPAGHMRFRSISQVAQPLVQPEKQKNNTFSWPSEILSEIPTVVQTVNATFCVA